MNVVCDVLQELDLGQIPVHVFHKLCGEKSKKKKSYTRSPPEYPTPHADSRAGGGVELPLAARVLGAGALMLAGFGFLVYGRRFLLGRA